MIFSNTDPYVREIASLPAIGLLSGKEPPINRARLAERLKDIAPEDQAEIDVMLSILAWSQIDGNDDDATFIERAEKGIAAIRSKDLRAVMQDRMEIRTAMVALRRRHAGGDAPARDERWGIGRYVETIRANWDKPDFGVGHVFPWILSAKDNLEAGDSAELERILLEAAWATAERQEFEHRFDFEALAFYLLRWRLADRWARYDADAAAVRFEKLLEDAVAESGVIKPERQDSA